MDVSRGSWGPQSKNYFGHADYYYHRGQGMSATDILSWVDSNFDKFSPGAGNQPGAAGGLYELMVRDRQREQDQARQDQMLQQTLEAQQASIEAAMASAPKVKQIASGSYDIGNAFSAKGVRPNRSSAKKTSAYGTMQFNRDNFGTKRSPLTIGLNV